MTIQTKSSKAVSLSPSALNLYRDCARCFWLDKAAKFRRPRGIFPSLPGGMDRVIKDYFDLYRKKGELPPEFHDPSFNGLELYPDQAQLDLWRDWRTGPELRDDDGSRLFGAIDDLMLKNGEYIPFDYKTKGSPTSREDAEKYYQQQLDCYSLMLEANGLPQAGYGYLLYYSPKTAGEKGMVQFALQAIQIQTDTGRALQTFRRAVKLVRSGEPPCNTSCEYCRYLGDYVSRLG